jgi:cytochrome c553
VWTAFHLYLQIVFLRVSSIIAYVTEDSRLSVGLIGIFALIYALASSRSLNDQLMSKENIKMKLSAAVFFASLLSAGAVVAEDALQANTEEGKNIIKAFVGDLKGELKKGMEQGGAVNAIKVCHTVAPQLSEAHSQMSGWRVARTSLKLRNADNAPDTWEKAVLKEFESRKAAGEDPMKLVKAEVVEQNGRQVFRMMKAIPTAEVCTKCHGVDIAEPVAAKLDELYPEDKARGFKAGDLRGAFTLKKVL